ncbi:MAG: hypothetical protein ACRYGK_12420 [Janthinobacterium lividum]
MSAQSTFFPDDLLSFFENLDFHRFFAEHALQLGDLGTAPASSLAGTTDSPALTAVKAPSRSSLRQLNNRLAATPL